MVYQSSEYGQTVKVNFGNPPRVGKPKDPRKGKKILKWLIALILIAAAVFAVLVYLSPKKETINLVDETPKTETPADSTPRFIDFNPVLNTWVSELSSSINYGVIIYDLNNDQIAGEKNADNSFGTASLYKLFVVYEGYRRVEAGEWDGESSLVADYTINECLDLAIRESNSTCAETLLSKIGRSELEDIIRNVYGLSSSSVTNLSSTPRDIMKMLKIYYNHKDLSLKTYAKIKDSMLDQPAVYNDDLCYGYCDWRQGLPSGFSEKVKVYNKVGWQGNGSFWIIYDDAAIVEFPDSDRAYIVVAMTENLPATEKTVRQLTRLGKLIEQTIEDYDLVND